MNARPSIREYLVLARLRRWLDIVHHPRLKPTCHVWRARKNALRLIRRYPDLARKIGISETSVFE